MTTTENISVPTVVKSSKGRVASVSVTTAGSGNGVIYDSSQLTVLTAPIYVIPGAISPEPYNVNLPVDSGIVAVPSAGQVIAVNWS